MLDRLKPYDHQTEALIVQIGERARNLFLTRQLLCAEAVLVALSQGLNGGLSEAQAVAMAAPFGNAMGESGCVCGALSGAVMASGLFLGREQPYRHRKEMRNSAHRLHDLFRAAHGATCCRVLSDNVRHDPEAHFQQCAVLTTDTAKMAAGLILEARPELQTQANQCFLKDQQSKISGLFRCLKNRLLG